MEDKEKKLPGVDDAEKKDPRAGKRGGHKGGKKYFKGGKGYPKHPGNDLEFWNQYPELMNIATRFPWMHIAGTQLKGNGVGVFLPNVLIQNYIPVPGVARSATDPINLAFRQLYLDMHRKYRGIGTYQASDIAIVIICIESVLQLLVEAERFYGLLKGYPLKSRIEPEGMLLALGYPSSLITNVKANLADFRYGINRLIELAKRLPLPQGMNFFKNHTVMNSFIYRDSKDERSSLFAFQSEGYYRFLTAGDSGLINNATTAQFMKLNRGLWTTYNLWFQTIEYELQKLLMDSDVLRITSDFIACYGESNMQILTPLPEDYRVDAVYSETMLHKFHNSERYRVYDANPDYTLTYRAVPSTTTRTTNGTFAIYQVDDVVYSLPCISEDGVNTWANVKGGQEFIICGAQPAYSAIDCAKGYVNDSWMAEPTQEVICESVLWKTMPVFETNQSDTTKHAISIEQCGTEILTNLMQFSISNSAVAGSADYDCTIETLSASVFADGLYMCDWAPLLFILDSSGNITTIKGDVDNVTVVTKDVISKVLDAALLSAFKVTISGGSSKE